MSASALESARDHYLARHEAFLRARESDPPWLAARRSEAVRAFADQGLPHNKLEEWRYTNVAPLARLPFEVATPAEIGREELEPLATPLFACSLFVFANGRFQPRVSSAPGLPGGARCDSLASLAEDGASSLEARLGHYVDPKQHPFAALNTAFLEDGAFVHAPRGDDVAQPVHVVFAHAARGGPTVTHPRMLVVAEAGSRITVVQDHVGTADEGLRAFTNAVTEIHVGRGAEVHWVLVQREPASHFHVSNLQVRQERDSRFVAHTLTLGGAWVRNDAGALLADEGAECGLEGLFVAGGTGLVDNHTLVDHAVPRCTSRELYKGVLGGKARGVFRGRVIVRPDAQHTDAVQSNPNLLIGRRAEIDTKPQLEIHADDVKCSHGSTIGRIDEDALFYLRSRAIPEDRARDLLTRGFALEVLEALPSRALAEGLDEPVTDALRRAREEAA